MTELIDVKTSVREVPTAELTSECWTAQLQGLAACEECEFKDGDCGGREIRRTGKNERGKSVPLGRAL